MRHKFVRPIKMSGMSYSAFRELGFPISRHLWENCYNTSDRNKGGGIKIPVDIKDSIKNFLREKSNIASNRPFVNKDPHDPDFKTKQNARYLEDQYSELYKAFEFSSEISRSTFYKYANISGEFKKPYRLTDLCDYCEKGKMLKREIQDKLRDLKFNYEEYFEPNKLIESFEKKKIEYKNFLSDESANNIEIKKKIDFIDSLIINLKDFDTIQVHIKESKYNRKILRITDFNFIFKNKTV